MQNCPANISRVQQLTPRHSRPKSKTYRSSGPRSPGIQKYSDEAFINWRKGKILAIITLPYFPIKPHQEGLHPYIPCRKLKPSEISNTTSKFTPLGRECLEIQKTLPNIKYKGIHEHSY